MWLDLGSWVLELVFCRGKNENTLLGTGLVDFEQVFYALKDIKKGSILNKSHFTVKGPGGGILPKYLDILVGKKARINIESDYPITWDIF